MTTIVVREKAAANFNAHFLVTGHCGGRRYVLYHGDHEGLALEILHGAFVKRKRVRGQHRLIRKMWVLRSRAREK